MGVLDHLWKVCDRDGNNLTDRFYPDKGSAQAAARNLKQPTTWWSRLLGMRRGYPCDVFVENLRYGPRYKVEN